MQAGYGLMKLSFWIQKKAFGGWEQDAEQAQHIFYSWPLVGGNDFFFFEKFAWHQHVILLTNQIFVAIYFWVTFVNGICLIILANRVIYSLANTSKQSKDMPQAFFNIPRLLQTMVKVSLTCALHTCFYSPFPFAPLRVSWTERSMSAMPFGRFAKGMSPSLGVSGLWRQWWHFPSCRSWVFLRWCVSYQAEVPDLLRESLAFHTGGISINRWEWDSHTGF